MTTRPAATEPERRVTGTGGHARVTPTGTAHARVSDAGPAGVCVYGAGTLHARVQNAGTGRTAHNPGAGLDERPPAAAGAAPAGRGPASPLPGTAPPLPESAPSHPRPPSPDPAPEAEQAPAPRRPGARALRTHFGTFVGVVILGALLWRLGTGVLLDGLRRIDTATVLVALAIGLVTTVLSAWRWQLVARGLRIRLPLGAAVADYYRALFLNAALPGGILGDVHRAVRHGQSAGDLRRGVKAVVLERVAGQIALAVFAAAVLPTLPSPVRADARDLVAPLALALAGALAVGLAVRMNRAPSRRAGRLGTALGEVRRCLMSRRNGPGIALSSAVVLAGHLATFVVAARVAGSAAPVAALVPLAVLALVAMGLPLNVGGFGPREGVTAWAFGAAGLGASTGVAVAVVYGVLSLVASLPGAVVLAVRRYAADPQCPRAEVSNAKYGSKDSARLASSAFPFSAEPKEGRPMTPDSV
ncbi:lysylphosphatidylglycerol synthase transmembrane domain-containing protein [Streptomyces yokosukanensis]